MLERRVCATQLNYLKRARGQNMRATRQRCIIYKEAVVAVVDGACVCVYTGGQGLERPTWRFSQLLSVRT